MHWQFVVFAMVPTVAFAVLLPRGTMRRAIGVAIFLSFVEFSLNSIALGVVEPFSLLSLILFAGLGALSLKRNSATYFRLQPVFLEASMAIVFLIAAYAYSVPLFTILLMDWIDVDQAIPAYQRGYYVQYADSMSRSVPYLLFLHAAVVGWAAMSTSLRNWVLLRTLGLHFMLVVLFFAERLLIKPV